MSEQAKDQGQSPEQSSSSWVLVVLFWGYVMIPLAWGVYETSKGVVALFTG